MQLLAMKHDGVLTWTGLEDSFADELALDLDEDPANVEVTLRYLLSCGLAETSDNQNFFLPYSIENTGSEGSSAKRMREYRERKTSLCDTAVTPPLRLSDGEIEKEIEKSKRKETESPSSEYSDDFEIFWNVYPKKVGKKEAYKAFRKANKPVQLLVHAVQEQMQSEQWLKENGRFIPNPSTWLNQGRWDDQVVQSTNPYLTEDMFNDGTGNTEDPGGYLRLVQA